MRVMAFSKAQLAIKLHAVICGECLKCDDTLILERCRDRSLVKARSMNADEKLPNKWLDRFNGSVRLLLNHSKERQVMRALSALFCKAQR